jgi:proline iminopeptidase
MTELHPLTEPYDQGMLAVGNGNQIYWEACGNPNGKPALVVHGGPGSGCTPFQRRYFDPNKYQIILFDQRGCGRSTPSASDPATNMKHNTTNYLISDMEKLREYLSIERWLLSGASWGSTLLLAYSEQHPERVTEIIISGVTTTRRSEIDWLYRGVGRFFPEAWERFRTYASSSESSMDIVAAYADLMNESDPAKRKQAADEWCIWEDTIISEEPNGVADIYSGRSQEAKLSFVRIASHYFTYGAWLEEGELIANASKLTGIPGVLIHGRFDLAAPLNTAWSLNEAWSDAELIIVEDSGHTGSDTMSGYKRTALDEFAEE